MKSDYDDKTQNKLNARDTTKNTNVKQPTPKQLLSRLNKTNGKPQRKAVSIKILEKADRERFDIQNFPGPLYLSPEIENGLYAYPKLLDNQASKENVKFISQYAYNWIKDKNKDKNMNQQNPILTINANAEIVGGHLWEEGFLAQEEAVAESSDLPLHMPAGDAKTHYYSSNKKELGLETLGGSYRVTNVRQYRLDDSNVDGISEEGLFDAVFVAAPDLRLEANYAGLDVDGERRDAYLSEVAAKVRMQCEHAIANGNNILGAGALGCGAFQNNPFLVAAIYRAVLSEDKYRHLKVDFVISNRDMCANFEKVFNAPINEVELLLSSAKPYDKAASDSRMAFETYITTVGKLKKMPTDTRMIQIISTEQASQEKKIIGMKEIDKLSFIRLGEGKNKTDRFVQVHFDTEDAAKNFSHRLHKIGIHKYGNPTEPVNIKQGNGSYYLRLNKEDYNKYFDNPDAYSELLLETYKQENRLDFSNFENCIYWNNQVGMMGSSHKIDIMINGKSKEVKVPESIMRIHGILTDTSKTANEKITSLCSELSGEKYKEKTAMKFFSARTDITQNVINETLKLNQQFAQPSAKLENK